MPRPDRRARPRLAPRVERQRPGLSRRAVRRDTPPPPSPSARGLALDTLIRVERDQAWADRVLEARFAAESLASRDRALATELTYGTLRWQRRLDWHLGAVSRRPLADLAPWVRALLRLSAYQLGWLDRVPPWAAVSEAVALAKRRRPPGAAAFVNGVLRALAACPRPWAEPVAQAGDDPVDILGLRASQPTWLVRRWASRYGLRATEALALAMNERPRLVLRVNTLVASPDEVRTQLESGATRVHPARFAPEALVVEGAGDPASLLPVQRGSACVQDEAAVLVGHALAPEPGETVADVCAAPGTKTTHLAQLMGNRGRILASDPHPARLARLRAAAARLGATIVDAFPGDAALLARRIGPACDRVLVDAPCSNLGVLRRNPDGKWRRCEADLVRLGATQRALLLEAATLVRRGGVLVYATCSLEPEENEAVVEAFRAARPDFAPDPMPAAVPAACREMPERLRMTPATHDTDGFTATRLRRDS